MDLSLIFFIGMLLKFPRSTILHIIFLHTAVLMWLSNIAPLSNGIGS